MRSVLLISACWLVFSCLAASAQSTGRHRVEREPEPEAAAGRDRGAFGFYVNAGAGLATSGDLFRLRTAGDSGIRWTPGTGARFQSESVLVTLDEDLALAAGFGGRLSGRLWWRLDGSVSAIDMAAQARIGEGVEIFRWDRLGFVLVTAAFEYRLTGERSFPYLVAGGGLGAATGEFDTQFDQTRPVARLGAGWEQVLIREWSLRAEVRDTVMGLDFEAYVPPVEGQLVPAYTIEDKGPVHVFELVLMLTGNF